MRIPICDACSIPGAEVKGPAPLPMVGVERRRCGVCGKRPYTAFAYLSAEAERAWLVGRVRGDDDA